MDRSTLIKSLIKRYKLKTYLEIGVKKGNTFFPVKCKRKIAVSEEFQFSSSDKMNWSIKNPRNLGAHFFEEPIRDFFSNRREFLLKKGPIDIAFIDALHTFDSTLQHILNILPYLNSPGFIVLSDCLPPHKAAAFPSDEYPTPEEQEVIEGWNGQWSGDVWKTIYYLRKELKDKVDAFVLKSDTGLGVISLKNSWNTDYHIDKSAFDNINKISYVDMIKDRESFLGLKTDNLIVEIEKL